MASQQIVQDPVRSKPDLKSFGKDVTKLVSGTVVAQIVLLLSYPVLTRLYDPEAMGVFSLFVSIVSIIATISCLRYNYAILIPENEKEAQNIFATCLGILSCICFISLVVLWICQNTIVNILDAPSLYNYILYIPLLVFIEGLFIILRYWNSRKKQFGSQAVAKTTQSVSIVGGQLGFGVAGAATSVSLIIAEILGRSVGVLLLLYNFIRTDLSQFRTSLQRRLMKDLLVRYKKFVLIDPWSALVNSISWQLPVLLLAGYFSPVIAGFYALGFKAFQMPMSLIGSSIEQVFFQRAAILKREGGLNILLEDVVKIFLMFTSIPIILLTVTGGDIFAVVFGEIWREAGVYTQILALWAFVWVIASPLNTLLQVLELHSIGFIMLFMNLITRAASLMIGGYYNDIYLALILFAISGILVYGSLIYIYFRKTHASVKSVLHSTRFSVIYAICSLGVLWALKQLYIISSMGMLILTAGCLIVYYLLLFRICPSAKEYLTIFLPFNLKRG
jgi:lipopolysaccharide exporter